MGIASDVGGLRDFVTPGVNRVRVPVRDPAALAGALARLIGDPAKRQRLAASTLATAPAYDVTRVLGAFARSSIGRWRGGHERAKRLSRQSRVSGLSAATNGLLLVLVVLATHRLGTDGYAIFSYAFVLAKIGESLMDFGLQQATIRGVARDRSTARAVFTNSIPMKALTGMAVALLLPIVPIVQWPAAVWPSVLMLAGSLLRSYVMTVRGVLQGLEQFAHDAAIEFADRALMLGFGAAALVMGYGVVGVCTGCLLARVVSLVWALAVAQRHVGAPRPAFDYALWKDLGRLASASAPS